MVSNSVYYHKYQKYKHKYLKLNQYGGTIIEDLSQLKDGLTSIIFKINQKLVPGLFPNSLQSITFSNDFDNEDSPLTQDLFPPNLESLTFSQLFTNGGTQLIPGLFPENLKKLEFGEYFENGDIPLSPMIFPSNLESLTFGNWFNNGGQPIKRELFPTKLKILEFGEYFNNGNQPITMRSLPSHLEVLIVNGYFDNGRKKFDNNTFPRTLTRLVVNDRLLKIHNVNPEDNPNWFHQFRVKDEPQLEDLEIQISQENRFIDQFDNDQSSQFIVDSIIKHNIHSVANLVNIHQLISILKQVLTFDQIGDQNRKRLVRKYIKLVPSEISIGLFPSDDTIMFHLQFWRKILPKFDQSFDQKTHIRSISNDNQTFINIVKMFETSFSDIDIPIQKYFKVKAIFSINIPIQNYLWNQRTRPSKNIRPVWHGTRFENLLSISRSGFTPINTPSYQINPSKSGSMFGSGIYTTDQSSKALYYANNVRSRCDSADNKNRYDGFLLLCDLDVGNAYHATTSDAKPDYSLPDEFDSLYADPAQISSIQRSERVVYDPSRVICRYLLWIVCNI